MRSRWGSAIFAVALCCWAAQATWAASITFDFESRSVGTFTPFTQTVGGVTATFSSPLDPAGPRFSVQNQASTMFMLSQFSGNYLYPNNLGVAPLTIVFSAPVNGISLRFATVEGHIASRMYLSAFLGATPAGSTTGEGAFIPGDSYPQGTVTFTAAAFDRVELSVPAQGTEPAAAFLVDTITVTTTERPAPVLQASWQFEEGDGQTTTDSVATIVGQLGSTSAADANDPARTPGRTGMGLSFSGAQFVAVPNLPALSPETITVEAWVRSALAPGVHEYVVAKGADDACTTGAYGLRTGDTGGLEFVVFAPAGSSLVSPKSPAAMWNGRWHFVTGTFDGATARLFVDGAEVGTGTAAASPFAIDYTAPDQRVGIGSYLGGNCGPGLRSFRGDIDQVGIWSGALAAADVTARFATLNTAFATETTLSANPAGTSTIDQPVVLTATVTSNNGAPDGTVEFFDGSTSLGASALTAGTAQVTVTTLPLGVHTLSAAFAPGPGFEASASGPLTHTVVSPPAPAETVTSLSSSPGSSIYSQPVTLTAGVTASGGGTPTGEVRFFDGKTLLAAVALVDGGASLMTTTLPVGNRSFTAEYVGGADFAPSTSAAVGHAVVSAGTTTTLESSPAAPCALEPVTLTATVLMPAPATAIPAGDVGFYDEATLMGTAPLVGGRATFSTTSLGVAAHLLTARYLGTPEASASESAGVAVTVSQAATTTTVTSNNNPAVLNRMVSIRYTVVVAAAVAVAGTPTGTVRFYDNEVLIGTKKLQRGVAILTIKYRTAGTHVITVQYSGSSAFGSSTSPALVQEIR